MEKDNLSNYNFERPRKYGACDGKNSLSYECPLLGKGKSSIFLQFCLEVVLVSLGALFPAFVAGNAITSYLLQTLLASGDQAALQDTLAKASGLSASILSFAESYVFLLLISCLSVALCFLFLFRKSPKEILSSIS